MAEESTLYRPQMNWREPSEEFDIHPECSAFPETKPEIRNWILDKMGKDGFSTHAPIWLTDEKPPRIAAGRCRYNLAKKLGIKYLTANLKAGTDIKEFCRMEQDYRKHLSDDVWRERRKNDVAELRQEGQSITQIAENLGVSRTTVARDIQDTVPEGTVETVVGKDKKKRKASTKAPILCDNCQRKGVQMAKCPGCKEAAMAYVRTQNEAKKAEKDAEKARKQKEKDDKKAAREASKKPPAVEPVDDYGTVLPKHCRDAYCDEWLPSAIEFLEEFVQTFWDEQIADGMNKRRKWYPWLDAKDVIDGVAQAGNDMKQILDHLKAQRPAGVCPACDGQKCPDCKHSGLVPKAEYEKLLKLLNKK